MRGLPGFDIVGLPEAGIRESRVRVLAALRNSGFELPEQRFVVNLAPADLRKSGSSFDLRDRNRVARAVRAVRAEPARRPADRRRAVARRPAAPGARVARASARRAAARPARRGDPGGRVGLGEPGRRLDACTARCTCARSSRSCAVKNDFRRRRRAWNASSTPPRRTCATCAASMPPSARSRSPRPGGHDVLMIGPPGAGKTMLARRLPGLLPPPSPSRGARDRDDRQRAAGCAAIRRTSAPFRAPHHSCSDAALVGGGDPIRPGEITLAHGGVLFLDELPEFRATCSRRCGRTRSRGSR